MTRRPSPQDLPASGCPHVLMGFLERALNRGDDDAE